MNLIGEHLDYNGGRCLPMALSQTTSAPVTLRDDDRPGHQWSRGAGRDRPQTSPRRRDGWAPYVAGVLRALDVRAGMDVDISSDVPIGAGLSSSAALECSVAVAVDAALGLGTSRESWSTACIRAENEFVGAPTGGLDQAISVFGEWATACWSTSPAGQPRAGPVRPAAHGLALLVVDTRVEHAMTDGSYGQRRDETWDDAARSATGAASLGEAASIDGLPRAAADRRARYVVRSGAGRRVRRGTALRRLGRRGPADGRLARRRSATTTRSPARSWT